MWCGATGGTGGKPAARPQGTCARVHKALVRACALHLVEVVHAIASHAGDCHSSTARCRRRAAASHAASVVSAPAAGRVRAARRPARLQVVEVVFQRQRLQAAQPAVVAWRAATRFCQADAGQQACKRVVVGAAAEPAAGVDARGGLPPVVWQLRRAANGGEVPGLSRFRLCKHACKLALAHGSLHNGVHNADDHADDARIGRRRRRWQRRDACSLGGLGSGGCRRLCSGGGTLSGGCSCRLCRRLVLCLRHLQECVQGCQVRAARVAAHVAVRVRQPVDRAEDVFRVFTRNAARRRRAGGHRLAKRRAQPARAATAAAATAAAATRPTLRGNGDAAAARRRGAEARQGRAVNGLGGAASAASLAAAAIKSVAADRAAVCCEQVATAATAADAVAADRATVCCEQVTAATTATAAVAPMRGAEAVLSCRHRWQVDRRAASATAAATAAAAAAAATERHHGRARCAAAAVDTAPVGDP
eukprot:261386-Chlamydomonas_euryale.AAC.1